MGMQTGVSQQVSPHMRNLLDLFDSKLNAMANTLDDLELVGHRLENTPQKESDNKKVEELNRFNDGHLLSFDNMINRLDYQLSRLQAETSKLSQLA